MTHNGLLNVSVLAGEIQPTQQAINPAIGKQVTMGDSGLIFHITPEIAKQWLPVLQTIAAEEK